MSEDAVSHLTEATFREEIGASDVPVVVDFWAEWCTPCKMIAPILTEIADEHGDKVKIAKVNVDENPGIASQLGIRSIPTLMLFKDGELASRQVGAAPKAKLEQWITASV
jgi:thioredoxin 1